jgi:Abortive infection C-terminus
MRLLRKRAIPEIEIEFRRALESVESDPPAALTAACSILESFCRIYLQEEGLGLPSDQSAKPLWNAVAHHIGFAPALQTDQDIKKVLSGFLSVVDGIACLRTHDGSAHGRERRSYRILPRHARLAVHAAHTLVLFGLETWTARKKMHA